MEVTSGKNRTPSRCREWERQRRNRFNEAIIKLGEVVKQIINSDTKCETTDNVQYPKIEIVQKAILCLTSCAQEKTQLKAEILALQVKLEAEKNIKPNKKDASIQVSVAVCRKNKNGKYMKLVMLQKSKKSALKENPEIPENNIVTTKIENKPSTQTTKTSKPIQKLPKLLPLTNTNMKKGPENTIVMLPGAPYIFPQRPLLFPTVPPAFVLLDSIPQTFNKPSTIPVINRNVGDMTKTTMVNILPITAYSRPLSATKLKKNNTKSKGNGIRKTVKKITKPINEGTKKSIVSKDINLTSENYNNTVKETADENSKKDKVFNVPIIDPENSIMTSDSNIKLCTKNKKDSVSDENSKAKNTNDSSISSSITTNSQSIPVISTTTLASSITEKALSVQTMVNIIKSDKIGAEKDSFLDEKDKESKIPNILDTTLCESAVDGGNARLELAEEFLAASPTAAFLMSFPLVSGNRADSPAEENHTIHSSKDNTQRRNDMPSQQTSYFPKSSDMKIKSSKINNIPNVTNKQNEQQKYIENHNVNKEDEGKTNSITIASNENPFLNLPMPSLIPTTCPLSDTAFGLDYDCNISKSNPSTNYSSSNNFFYKSDPLNTAKNTIYSTSNISSGHEFNSLGLYPCAMEKFATKNKSDFVNVEDNLMKIGPSRLTYDIDLGWSHKGFDFVNCTSTSNTFNKDNILTTAPMQYSSSYNPFNPEFHVPLVTNNNKRDNVSTKTVTSYSDAITSFYSQPTNLWSSEDVSLYTSSNISKNFTSKHQNYVPLDHIQTNIITKSNAMKQFETKQQPDTVVNPGIKSSNIEGVPILPDKYTKKSPNKMHINWMTSEIRPVQNNCNQNTTDLKENHKISYPQINHVPKKQDHTNGNYFPINMHNFTSQVTQEEFQVWPTARAAGTTEISIEPPPINLPTLVGDLALGPHDKKKNDAVNRGLPLTDLQNCSNFFSVSQLMNRSTDIPSRYHGPNLETVKPVSNSTKQGTFNVTNIDIHRKNSRVETNISQPHVFNEFKPINYENINQYQQNKSKINKSDKNSKNTKTSYSAESLIRGGSCNKATDNSCIKYGLLTQKYNDFNVPQDSAVAQVSHFPPIIDYTDNSYTSQQFSGTTLYNSTTNTISNSFYSNFMSGSSNLMTGNYGSGHFSTDFVDYNQSAECNYNNYRFEDLKMKTNPPGLHPDKTASQYKSSKRESIVKHKLECTKKDSNKKCHNKRPKLNNEAEEWSDTTHLLWQNKAPVKRHPNTSEDLTFPNYVGNQTQYQPEFFNTHLVPANMQNMGHNMDRSLASFPATSRANFNLSTIFPEITMKVQ